MTSAFTIFAEMNKKKYDTLTFKQKIYYNKSIYVYPYGNLYKLFPKLTRLKLCLTQGPYTHLTLNAVRIPAIWGYKKMK